MNAELTSNYERDQRVWNLCARDYERQVVTGHPDVTAYEDFEEDFLDRLLLHLMRDRGCAVRLFDAGCGSARLHLRFGLQMMDDSALPPDHAAEVRRARMLDSRARYAREFADRLRVVEGVDFAPEMLTLAREKLSRAGLGPLIGGRLKLYQGSAFDLRPMAPDPLPVVVSVCNSIGVMQGPAGAVELFRAMRRAVETAGGIAIISAYQAAAVATHALGNYESTMDVCGQPRWLEPDTYAGEEYRQIPWNYKRAHDTDPRITVDVVSRQGELVLKGHRLCRNAELVQQVVRTGHIQTHADYESRWYSFGQFSDWIAAHWPPDRTYHLPGKRLDAIRAEPAQLAILDAGGWLDGLMERWR